MEAYIKILGRWSRSIFNSNTKTKYFDISDMIFQYSFYSDYILPF